MIASVTKWTAVGAVGGVAVVLDRVIVTLVALAPP